MIKLTEERRDYDQMMMERSGPVTSALFEDALAHLEQHGWCQGNTVDMVTGTVCAEGAFGLAEVVKTRMVDFDLTGAELVSSRHNRRRMETFTYRNDEIMDLMGISRKDYRSVIDWNDAPDRTETEVIEALTLGAKKLRELGR